MDRYRFIKNMAKTGEVSSDQFTMFLLEHYFMQGKNLEDYHDDLTCEFEYSDQYASLCVKSAKSSIKEFLKNHEGQVETWKQEQERKRGECEQFK